MFAIDYLRVWGVINEWADQLVNLFMSQILVPQTQTAA